MLESFSDYSGGNFRFGDCFIVSVQWLIKTVFLKHIGDAIRSEAYFKSSESVVPDD